MTATNHVLTGALLGLTIHQPLPAIALALISHFILDSLPHYGDTNHVMKRFLIVLSSDMTAASLLLMTLAVIQPPHWQLSLICAIVAASPDLMWLPGFTRDLRGMAAKPKGSIQQFHKNIQWGEKRQNYPAEIVWAGVCVLLLVKII